MSLHTDLAHLLLQRDYTGVSGEDANTLRRALLKGDAEALHEWLPPIVRDALQDELERYYER